MTSIALVMIVKNEEKILSRCLNSIKNFVDDIIIADTGSTDDSKKIALSFGAKVYDYKWNDNFSDARNYALKHSKCKYNIILDADEYVVKWDKKNISNFIDNSFDSIGRIIIKNFFMNKNDKTIYKDYASRLFPNGIFFTGKIHEQLDTKLPRKTVPIEVEHDGYINKNKSARNILLLRALILENPSDPYYLYQISKEYKGLDNYQQANVYIEKAYSVINRNLPYYPSLIVEYINILMAQKKYESALTIVRNESVFLNNYPDYQFVSALLYMDLIIHNPQNNIEYLEKIEKCYLTCIKLGESSEFPSIVGTGTFLAQYNLGIFYEFFGYVDKAIEYYSLSSGFGYTPAIVRLESLIPKIGQPDVVNNELCV